MEDLMADEKNTSNTIKFKYKFDDDYNPIYVNGAHGGISTSGEIIINFYLERHPVPNTQIHEINQEGYLGKEINREPADNKSTMIRYIKNGVVLNLESAVKIRDFLDKQIQMVESIQNK